MLREVTVSLLRHKVCSCATCTCDHLLMFIHSDIFCIFNGENV